MRNSIHYALISLILVVTSISFLGCDDGGGSTGSSVASISSEATIGTGVLGTPPASAGGPTTPDFTPPSSDIIVSGVPWISQTSEASNPDWSTTKTCGPASSAMIAMFHLPGSTTMKQVSDYIETNYPGSYGGWKDGDGSYTSFEQNKSYLEFRSLSVSIVTNAGYNILKTELSANRPVFVWLETQGSNSSEEMKRGENHFMLVTGITPTHIVVHDPGRGPESEGKYRKYTLSSFKAIWADKSYSAMLVNPAGGGASPPAVQFGPTIGNFGNVQVGTNSDISFTLTSNGGSDAFGTISVLGNSDFSIQSGGGSYTLQPGAQKTVTVRFNPSGSGSRSATLQASVSGAMMRSSMSIHEKDNQ